MEGVDRYDVIVREFMNGVWFVLAVIMSGYLVYYLADRYRSARDWWENEKGPKPGILRVWYNWEGVRLALAILVVYAADTLRAGWVFLILNQRIQTNEPIFLINWWPIGLIAVCMAVVGTLCAIRVLSGRKSDWVVAAFIALFTVLVLEWLTRNGHR
jgi:hypothetical protein